jgi:predicted TIM-barrel fold metal-dependent hydrolase
MHRIDVHHHLFPPAFVAGLVDSGHYLSRGIAKSWTPRVSIEDMDAAGVATAYTSITAPGFDVVAQARRIAATRECNEYGARMAADHPGRFGLFASLPLPDVDASLKEIAYALDVLKADGIGLLTSYRDKWLGDPAFAPVMDELDRRRAVVYVHPTTPDCCRNLMDGIADWVIEFPVDTTRTIASLLFSGTVARCRNIRFIFAHLGGILPLVASHLERAAEVDATLQKKVPGTISGVLRGFHYDTALRANPGALKAALELIGVPQILFGTDAPLRRSRDQLQGLLDHGFTPQDLRRIECDNAAALLSRRAR